MKHALNRQSMQYLESKFRTVAPRLPTSLNSNNQEAS